MINMNIINTNFQKRYLFLSNKILIGLIPLLLLSMTIGSQSFVYAGNNNDNEVSCFDRGIIDGEDHPFSQRTYDNCGDDYYQGFIEGCMSIEGNSKDSCESATDG